VATGLAQSISSIGRHSGVRFVIVGGLSFLADAGSLFVLHGVAKVWLPLATALAYCVAFVVNFGLNRQWVFATGANGRIPRQVHRYLYLVAGNLVLTVIWVPALTFFGLPYLIAKLVTAAVLAIINYFVSRRWIFV
jgi:putative flippase GtrA